MRRFFVALGLLLTMAAPQTYAANVALDAFTLGQQLFLSEGAVPCGPPCSATDTVNNDGSFWAGFDKRTMHLFFNSANSSGMAANVAAEVVPAENVFSYSSTDGEDGYAYLEYYHSMGTPTDLTNMGMWNQFAFLIQNDVAAGFWISVDDGGGYVTVSKDLPMGGDQVYPFPFSDFAGVDFTNVLRVKLHIDGIGHDNLDANIFNPPFPEPYTLTMLGLGVILLGRRLSKRRR